MFQREQEPALCAVGAAAAIGQTTDAGKTPLSL
jgi:hypothetical protein